MRFHFAVAAILFLALALQEFVPVSDWAYGARLLLVHTVFLSAAVAVPMPTMLLFALLAGFLWDARHHVPIYPEESSFGFLVQSEIPFGFTILLLALGGTFIQGLRPLFRRGRWELPVLMVGVCTAFILAVEYIVISFHRGGLEVRPELGWKMLMTSLFSALLSPFLLLFYSRVAHRTQYRIRMDGLRRRHTYDGDAL